MENISIILSVFCPSLCLYCDKFLGRCQVESTKIPAIESSKIGNYLYYYDKQEPKEIAKAIMNINMDDNYDSQQIIKKLDIDFKKELEEMLISENEL